MSEPAEPDADLAAAVSTKLDQVEAMTLQMAELRADVAVIRAGLARAKPEFVHRPGAGLASRGFHRVLHGVSLAQNEPLIQFRIHVAGMWFWLASFPAVIIVFELLPGFWNRISILYVVLVSLYANISTDYDGLSSSLAALHARRATHQAEAAESAVLNLRGKAE